MIQRLFYCLILLIALPIHAAQNRAGFWSLLSLYGDIGPYLFNIQPQVRLYENGGAIDQFLTDAGIGYHFSPTWQGWLGASYLINDQDTLVNIREARLWEELNWQHPIGSSSNLFMARTRLEQRKAAGYTQIANRIRQRVLFFFPYDDKLGFIGSEALFVNLNQVPWVITKTLDQNRLYLGLEHKTTRQIRLGFGYLNQSIFSTPVQSFHIAQVSIFWKLSPE